VGVGYKLWTAGELLASADVNSYLMKQTVISCTSGTRPASPQDGMLLWETDTERYTSWNATLAAWVPLGQMITGTHVPVVTGSTTNPTLGTGSTAVGRYTLWNGKMCTYYGKVTFGSSGVVAGSGQYFVSLPVTSAATASIFYPGSAMFRDDSAGTVSPGVCYIGTSVATLSLTSTSGIAGSGTPWAWAALDYFTWNVTYETT
jgi:hypothetical protein